jgi:CRP/FNR family transcriptional regulator, cyclic AMP receptor protein
MDIESLTIIKGIEKIQEYSLFKGLSFEETRILANICRLVNKHEGEIIIEENSVGNAMYLILEGEAIVFQGESDPRRKVAILKPGEIFGEMSLIDDVLTSSSVAPIGEMQLLKINKGDLAKLMRANDRIAAKIYRSFCMVLADRLRKTTRRISEEQVNG